ncbi:acetate kinase, partial [Tothia fuscella]
MTKYVLAVNAGSSSLKCRLFRSGKSEPEEIAVAKVSGLNSEKPEFAFKPKPEKEIDQNGVKSHEDAFAHVLSQLSNYADIPDLRKEEGVVVAHRVVHGGDYEKEVEITNGTYHVLEKLESLAPLHNASALSIIKFCSDELPKATNMAFFDSAFHQTIPEAVRTYAIDPKIAKEKGLRKYGFHGISYQYILRRTAEYLQKPQEETSLIVMHLGAGASMCAIKKGKSIDTTMGLTPVSGLPGATRTGDIDPSLVFHYTSAASDMSRSSTTELHITKAEEILNKESGWKALTGSSNFADIAKPDVDASKQLAFDMFVDRIVGYAGNYFVKLGGEVDALVFAGGIGESSALLRAAVVDRLKCLGFEISKDKNEAGDEDAVHTIHKGKKSVLVCETDEEGEMA